MKFRQFHVLYFDHDFFNQILGITTRNRTLLVRLRLTVNLKSFFFELVNIKITFNFFFFSSFFDFSSKSPVTRPLKYRRV